MNSSKSIEELQIESNNLKNNIFFKSLELSQLKLVKEDTTTLEGDIEDLRNSLKTLKAEIEARNIPYAVAYEVRFVDVATGIITFQPFEETFFLPIDLDINLPNINSPYNDYWNLRNTEVYRLLDEILNLIRYDRDTVNLLNVRRRR